MSIHELQARLKTLDEAQASGDQRAIYEAASTVVVWARRVAEGAGEPVAWRWPGGAWQDGEPHQSDKADLKEADVTPDFAYTTPPSADDLVEAIQTALVDHGEQGCAGCTAVDAALAKHKENTDGR